MTMTHSFCEPAQPVCVCVEGGLGNEPEHSVMFTTTYTLNSREVGDAVKKHWHILSSDPALPAEFKNPPLICV